MKDATVAVQAIRDVLNYASARGVDAAQLARDAGVDTRKLADNNARLSGSSLGRIWEAAAERTGDPLFGLRLGSLATAGQLGILGYTMLSSTTLGGALDRLVRYGHLYTFGIDFDVHRGGGVLRIECGVVRHVANYLVASPRHPLECTIAAICAVSSSLAGRTVPVRSVAMAHADPDLDPDEYRRLLGVRPAFGAGVYAVELEGRAADWPIATASADMLETLDAKANDLLSELGGGEPVSDRVVRAISAMLKGEAPKVEDVSRTLAMSRRSLQRALSEEGTTYQALLERTRHGLAVRYLADSRAVIFDVAFLLGFSEPSAFHRAFKRWTGSTPRQFQLGQDRAGGPPTAGLPA